MEQTVGSTKATVIPETGLDGWYGVDDETTSLSILYFRSSSEVMAEGD
jgi:hypothetical protein